MYIYLMMMRSCIYQLHFRTDRDTITHRTLTLWGRTTIWPTKTKSCNLVTSHRNTTNPCIPCVPCRKKLNTAGRRWRGSPWAVLLSQKASRRKHLVASAARLQFPHVFSWKTTLFCYLYNNKNTAPILTQRGIRPRHVIHRFPIFMWRGATC